MTYEIQENVSLKPYNTFGIEAVAEKFVRIKTVEQLEVFLKDYGSEEFLLLGGGSNMLFTKDRYSLVLKLDLLGKKIVQEDDKNITVECMAGENWHEFVMWTLEHNWGGLENLSLIPGNVGTAPMQNIGAYGVEVKDTIFSVEFLERKTGNRYVFGNNRCNFGYRTSYFKEEGKGRFIIVAVRFKLAKDPQVQATYKSLQEQLESEGITNPTIYDVSKAVMAVRQSKLPDPKVIGNAGSFFKNPVVDLETADKLGKDAPGYPQDDGMVKIPAGWLIEQAGWKGKRVGNCGVHEKQALVLVNHGGASGNAIWQLGQEIQKDVKERFGIELQPEVNIV